MNSRTFITVVLSLVAALACICFAGKDGICDDDGMCLNKQYGAHSGSWGCGDLGALLQFKCDGGKFKPTECTKPERCPRYCYFAENCKEHDAYPPNGYVYIMGANFSTTPVQYLCCASKFLKLSDCKSTTSDSFSPSSEGGRNSTVIRQMSDPFQCPITMEVCHAKNSGMPGRCPPGRSGFGIGFAVGAGPLGLTVGGGGRNG